MINDFVTGVYFAAIEVPVTSVAPLSRKLLRLRLSRRPVVIVEAGNFAFVFSGHGFSTRNIRKKLLRQSRYKQIALLQESESNRL